MSADPTFIWKFLDVPKRSETGLKPSEIVGKQLYPLILHFYGNLWTSQRSVPSGNLTLHLYGNF